MSQAQRRGGQPPVLPLRPLTVGELLDAAVALLRVAAPRLLPVAVALAAIEQAVLWPIRKFAQVEPPEYGPDWSHFGAYWLLLAAGFALEAAIIALLGGVAARAAGEAVIGPSPRSAALRPHRWRLLLIAAVCGAVTGVAALAGPPLWAIGYALFGLAAPALVLDRVGPLRALGRSVRMVVRSGARAGGIQVVGYLGWLGVRIALGLGAAEAIQFFNVGTADWRAPAAFVAWTIVNAIAYPSLACLNAVLHLETRMRVEGLDIRLARAAAHGPVTPAHLAVWR